MTKQDFIKKFPDVKVQQFETDTVLSKQEIKEMVKQFTNSLDMGLIYYEQCDCNVTVFTSDKMKSELDKMNPGYQVTDPNTGEVGTIVSDKFIVCGNYCVRVKFPSGEDVYDCDFFIQEEKINLYISLMKKVEEWFTPEVEGVDVMILLNDFNEIEKKLSLEKEYQHLIEDHISASVEMKALQPYIKLFNHPTINKWYQENKNNMSKYEICISKPETENS